MDIQQTRFTVNDGMEKRGSCHLIYSSFHLQFRCLEADKRNETFCINHFGKSQMNTFWCWRWKMCLYKYYSNYVTDLKWPRDDAIRNIHMDTNCVHWAQAEIDEAAPEERIIYVCQRSIFYFIFGMTKTSKCVSIGLNSINYCIFSRWLVHMGLNFKLESREKQTQHMDQHSN